MTSTHNQNICTINPEKTVADFKACVTDFIAIIDRENACIQEYDTQALIHLLPLKKQCSDRYEAMMIDIDELLSLKILSKNDVISLSVLNQEFMKKSAENNACLEQAHEYFKRLITVIVTSHNQINKHLYTARGEMGFVKSNAPIALSQNL